ncbi:MAG TPA: class I tRNA ligase family protein, partial [Anaerolineae bacterium]
MNNTRVPIWIADYVLTTYGTGAIMGVPAHDERDFDFALRYGLPILPVIERPDGMTKSFVPAGTTNDGFADTLRTAQIPFEEKQGSLYVTIPHDKVARYVELAEQNVRANSWNEVVGTRWLFIFHDGVKEWNSPEAEQKILARCKELESDVRGKRTVMEMLYGVEFYRDVLFHHEYGTMIHSGEFSGTPAEHGRERVADAMEQRGIGKRTVHYRLRDWLISRQRYWGTPIPIVYCPTHGAQPVPESELPVLLPLEGVEFLPGGESPLARHKQFVKAKCPICGEKARRDTDTMDTFVDSSWYQYAYLDPYDITRPIDVELAKKWTPVDQYSGGIEHATVHLMYTRFWTKVMRDMGLVQFDEPLLRLFNQGDVVARTYKDRDGKYVKPNFVVERDGHFYHVETNEELTRTVERMSKSKQNGVSPDELVKAFGTDAVRLYLMFQGPWDEGFAFKWEPGEDWDRTAIGGIARWLNRVWTLVLDPARGQGKIAPATPDQVMRLRRGVHHTIKRVTGDVQSFKFNTAIAAMMELTNMLGRAKEAEWYPDEVWGEAMNAMMLILAPFAPHITEEMWARLGGKYSIHQQAWPSFDAEIIREEMFTLVVQVNGKVRGKVELPVDVSEAQAKEAALSEENVKRHLNGKSPRQVIYVPGRLVNIVV